MNTHNNGSNGAVVFDVRKRRGVLLIVVLAILAAAAMSRVPPFTDPSSYYDFADRRQLLGIPNFMDVMSNLSFLIVGLLGLMFVARAQHAGPARRFADGYERCAYGVLFAGLAFVSFGSGYFHLRPAAATLLWDRLPMSVAFMALFAIVIADRIDRKAGYLLLLPLIALGVGSVLHWHRSELLDRGDLRLYVLVQFFPLLVLPLMLWLFPAGHTRTRDLLLVIVWYALAKLLELADKPLFAATGGTISGHTLKHLAAGLATVYLYRMMSSQRYTRIDSVVEVITSSRRS
jgi:hypothetical protein